MTEQQQMYGVHPHGGVYATADPSMEIGSLLLTSACASEAQTRAQKNDVSFVYWRDFAGLYIRRLCRQSPAELVTEGVDIDIIDAPNDQDLLDFRNTVPPMPGAEYVGLDSLRQTWTAIGSALAQEISELAGDDGIASEQLQSWIAQHGNMWNQCGRVCLHIVENPNDEARPFAFIATYAPMDAQGRIAKQHKPLAKALQEYAGSQQQDALRTLLEPLQRGSVNSDILRELINSEDIYHPLAWTVSEAYAFLKDMSLLEESGISLRVPNWWRKKTRPQVQVTLGDTQPSAIGTKGILDFSLQIALGDEKMSVADWEELRRASQQGEGLLRMKGQWVELDQTRLQAALDHWQSLQKQMQSADGGMSFIEGMRLLAGTNAQLDVNEDHDELLAWSQIHTGSWLQEQLSAMRGSGSKKGMGVSPNLLTCLRPYQELGYQWLMHLTRLGLGACLADDMGLGKTMQVLSVLLAYKDGEKNKNSQAALSAQPASLLIVPTSLIGNWKSEIEKFSPVLNVCYLHSSQMKKSEIDDLASTTSTTSIRDSYDLVIVTYGMLSRMKWLSAAPWNIIILDEAQAIKNAGSQQTRAVKKIPATARIALTGTPIENRLGDVWSLFDFLCPGLLGTAGRFKTFVKQLRDRSHDQYAPLRNLIQPYILRRLKSDKSIIDDLPDKIELNTYCGLAKPQAALYMRTVQELAQILEEKDSSQSAIKRRGLVLSYLTRFKQICNHPDQFLGSGGNGGEFDEKSSGKFIRLRMLAEEISQRQEKVLIFTQYRSICDPLAEFLHSIFGRAGLVLHGGTAAAKRQKMVDAFQSENGPPFFVLSLRAGGTGLNLTAANHVVHFDRWWNPAVENQATDRAYRIGQHRNVLVHKFVCSGTIEEKIDGMLADKQSLADDLLQDSGEKLVTELNDAELLQMVTLDIEKAQL